MGLLHRLLRYWDKIRYFKMSMPDRKAAARDWWERFMQDGA